MRSLQSILLATDFRPASYEAVKVAERLASAFGSHATLLHVLEPQPSWPFSLRKEEVVGPLRKVAAQLSSQEVGVAEPVVMEGPIADTIVRKAQKIDADLILIGAGERSRSERFSVGPIAAAILEHSPTPVLAVRPGEPVLQFRKILCPVDYSGASRRGLQNAVRLARALGAGVVVLTVVPEVSLLSAAVETGQFAGAKAEHDRKWHDDFARFLAGIPFDDVKFVKEVRRGVPHQQIVQAVQDHQADLVIMGATGRTGLARLLLGSVSRRILQALPCSMLMVKEEDLIEEAIEDDLRFLNLLTAQGRELLSAGDLETALAKFRRVLAHNPFHVPAIRGLAETLEKQGRQDQAIYYRRRIEDLTEGAWK